MKKPMIAAILIAFAALLVVPTISVAKDGCKLSHYCFDPSWGCRPCRYVEKEKNLAVQEKSAVGTINNIKNQIKRLQSTLAAKTRALASIQRARKANISTLKQSKPGAKK